MKLADMQVLEACPARGAGSNPAPSTLDLFEKTSLITLSRVGEEFKRSCKPSPVHIRPFLKSSLSYTYF